MTRFFALAILLAACSKTEPAPAPSASSVAPATAAPATSKVEAPIASGAAPSGSAAAADCGGKENPCPLQLWMRENVNTPMNKKDMPGLADALDKIAKLAPPEYANWASISKDGAAAARQGDEAAVKASCRSCHDQYKQKYKTEMRARKVQGV